MKRDRSRLLKAPAAAASEISQSRAASSTSFMLSPSQYSTSITAAAPVFKLYWCTSATHSSRWLLTQTTSPLNLSLTQEEKSKELSGLDCWILQDLGLALVWNDVITEWIKLNDEFIKVTCRNFLFWMKMMMFRLAWCCLVLLVLAVESLKELSNLKPHEVALMQFDSRPLENYWLSAALWNQAYARSHGHRFIYYTLDTDQSCTYGEYCICMLRGA